MTPVKCTVIDNVPLLHRAGLVLPAELSAFPDCCGAGNGLGEWVVPERVYGLRISPSCFIHDDDWEEAPPTWDAFRAANSRFLDNLLAQVETQSRFWPVKFLRRHRVMDYYGAVTDAHRVFWRLKKRQMTAGLWVEYVLPKNV